MLLEELQNELEDGWLHELDVHVAGSF